MASLKAAKLATRTQHRKQASTRTQVLRPQTDRRPETDRTDAALLSAHGLRSCVAPIAFPQRLYVPFPQRLFVAFPHAYLLLFRNAAPVAVGTCSQKKGLANVLAKERQSHCRQRKENEQGPGPIGKRGRGHRLRACLLAGVALGRELVEVARFTVRLVLVVPKFCLA
jgi:hypothetical protein